MQMKRKCSNTPNEITCIDIVSEDGVVLELTGRMTYENSKFFFKGLMEKIRNKQCYIVDLNSLEKIDSTGLGTLLNFAQSVQSQGGKVAFVAEEAAVKEPFVLAKFDSVFPVSHNRQIAWQMLQNGYLPRLSLADYRNYALAG